jgi:glycosyltransferase involved in cell wall biosynthesis
MTKKDKKKMPKFPLVSIITPTFNRRPFVPMMLKCFEHQTYPKDRMEWIIIDDGTDKIEDMVSHIPQVKYFKYDEKMVLGRKRNLAHEKSTGDILVYMDDDDYYPPERVKHCVETLRNNPKALCAGSSKMHIYFKHINKMYQFGPYGPNHATAATFAFRRELLELTKYDETAALAEERAFLKDYTIPFVQMDSQKTILVFSHNHNSFDKKKLLETLPNPTIHETELKVEDFVKESDIYKFFMEEIDDLLDKYVPGKPENKPDVLMQTEKLKIEREKMAEEMMKKKIDQQVSMSKIMNYYNQNATIPLAEHTQKVNEMNVIIQNLTNENAQMKDKMSYLENKIRELITSKIQEKRNENSQA